MGPANDFTGSVRRVLRLSRMDTLDMLIRRYSVGSLFTALFLVPVVGVLFAGLMAFDALGVPRNSDWRHAGALVAFGLGAGAWWVGRRATARHLGGERIGVAAVAALLELRLELQQLPLVGHLFEKRRGP